MATIHFIAYDFSITLILLQKTDKRIITNYIIWRYTSAWSFQLDQRYDDIQQVCFFYIIIFDLIVNSNSLYNDSENGFQNFLRAMIGKQVKSPRWKDCVTAASGRMTYAAGAIYVREYFKEVCSFLFLMIRSLLD